VPAPVAAGAFNAADIADPSKLNAPLPAQPQGPLVSDPNFARIVEERPGSSVELRKEFQQAPAYKKYTGSISDYNNVVRAATEGEPNNTTDLNIIYSIAKIFHPDSAVKDGELKLPNATGSIAQQLSSLYTRLLSDRGMMDAETRAHLVSEATRRVNEYKESMNVTNTQYADLARRIGVPPEAVITQVPPMLPYNEADALRAGGGTARGPAAPAPAVPTAPPPRPRF